MSEEKMINKISVLNFGRLYREAEITIKGLEISFRLHLNTLENLDNDTFWDMLADFKKEIDRTIPSEITNPSISSAKIRLAINRFIHGYFFGEENDISRILRFIKTYRTMSEKLYEPLFKVVEGFGDDGYGDILDSFPLFGRKRYEAALEGKIEGDSEDQYQGENYIETSLESEAFSLFCSHYRYEADEIESEDLDESIYFVVEKKIYNKLGLKSSC